MLLALKTQIRTTHFRQSKKFYTEILNLELLDEWDADGDRGLIVGFPNGGFIELLEYSHPNPHENEPQITLQLKTEHLDQWAAKLKDVWPAKGPVTRPWGNRYLWLRDPNNVPIALFEGT